MATPAENNLKNFNGKYLVNRAQTGDIDSTLALQGIGFLIRKALKMMEIRMHSKSYTDADGIFHIDSQQIAPAGFKASTETRIFDGKWHDKKDFVFGPTKEKTDWISLSDLKDSDEDEKYLKSGFDAETEASQVVDAHIESVGNGWIGRQVWGFEDVGGVRKHVRHLIVRKGDKVVRMKMTMDYEGVCV